MIQFANFLEWRRNVETRLSSWTTARTKKTSCFTMGWWLDILHRLQCSILSGARISLHQSLKSLKTTNRLLHSSTRRSAKIRLCGNQTRFGVPRTMRIRLDNKRLTHEIRMSLRHSTNLQRVMVGVTFSKVSEEAATKAFQSVLLTFLNFLSGLQIETNAENVSKSGETSRSDFANNGRDLELNESESSFAPFVFSTPEARPILGKSLSAPVKDDHRRLNHTSCKRNFNSAAPSSSRKSKMTKQPFSGVRFFFYNFKSCWRFLYFSIACFVRTMASLSTSIRVTLLKMIKVVHSAQNCDSTNAQFVIKMEMMLTQESIVQIFQSSPKLTLRVARGTSKDSKIDLRFH